MEPIPLIAGKPRALRPHQQQMLEALCRTPRCAVWAGMGMGKTSVTLALLDLLYGVLGEHRPTLVLAPKRVATDVWPVESAEWQFGSLRVVSVVGALAERKAALSSGANVFVCNYENAAWLVKHYGAAWPFATVVADESTRIKGFRLHSGGIRARALGRVAHTKVERWINLTGTPTPNGLEDLWGQTWFLDEGRRLGHSFTAFKTRWFQTFDIKDANGRVCGRRSAPTEWAMPQIIAALADITVVVRPEDWFSLDKPIVTTVKISLPPEARAHYRQLEKELFTWVGDHQVEAITLAAKSGKCLQLASGAVYTTAPETGEPTGNWVVVHTEKIKALESIIAESAGAPVLVSYTRRADLASLRTAFPAGVELRDAPDTIARWNAGAIPLMFIQPQSAAHGINLQFGGNILVFYSYDWNLESHDQVIERIGPMRQKQAGLDRPVFVYYIAAKDTLDMAVLARLVEKASVQDALKEAMSIREKEETL